MPHLVIFLIRHQVLGALLSSFQPEIFRNEKLAPLSWCSKKLERVAKTIIYAEGIALGRCLDEAVNLRQALLQMLNVPERTKDREYTYLPIIGITDSKSLWDNYTLLVPGR